MHTGRLERRPGWCRVTLGAEPSSGGQRELNELGENGVEHLRAFRSRHSF